MKLMKKLLIALLISTVSWIGYFPVPFLTQQKVVEKLPDRELANLVENKYQINIERYWITDQNFYFTTNEDTYCLSLKELDKLKEAR